MFYLFHKQSMIQYDQLHSSFTALLWSACSIVLLNGVQQIRKVFYVANSRINHDHKLVTKVIPQDMTLSLSDSVTGSMMVETRLLTKNRVMM